MRLFPVLAVILLIWGTGCAGSAQEVEEGPTATVRIQNRNWLSMEIYAQSPGERVRLGRLAAGRNRTYTLPSRLFEGGATRIVFEMEAIGSEGETIRETQTVAPGDIVILVIPNTR